MHININVKNLYTVLLWNLYSVKRNDLKGGIIMKSLELYCSVVDGEIVKVLEECTCKTKRPVWNTQGLIKTAQNCPHWNNSSVLWRKRLSASNITTLSYSTKLHAYSLFNDSLNLLSKLSWCLYGFSRFSTLTTFAPSSFSLDNTPITTRNSEATSNTHKISPFNSATLK